jgi:hypothetical protein
MNNISIEKLEKAISEELKHWSTEELLNSMAKYHENKI